MLLLSSGHAIAQGCNCPPVNTCGACQGGVNYLELRYNGVLLPAVITVLDGINVRYNALVGPGATFSFVGSLSDGKFAANQATIAIDGIYNAIIDTSCGSPVYINSTYGSFTVVRGNSKNGGPLCCSPTDVDNIPPTLINCPSNVAVFTSTSSCSGTASWTIPTPSDNCNSVQLEGSHNPGTLFPLGTTQVTYTATDNNNNEATCSFNVIVTDNIGPVINNCPPNITVFANTSCQAIATWAAPTATDNCTVTLTSSHNSGATFPLGTTKVTYTATDGSGNSTLCTFDVRVIDNTPPVITGCPSNITLSAGASCQAITTWTPPTARDNCSAVTMTSSHSPTNVFLVGQTAVTYTATDASGNSSSCTFNVIVEDKIIPVFTNCPVDISITTDNDCEAVVQWTTPGVTDNCDVEITSNHLPGETFLAGTTSVEYKATDASGNIAYCRFNVIVNNNEPPEISGCPDDISAKAGASGEVSVTWESPTATSLCGNVSLTSSHEPGDKFRVGTTLVTYNAIDDSGNEAECSFNVIVTYLEPEFTVSQIVTPNGDGINDEWIVSSIENFDDNNVMIFDRWGGVIYHASGYNNNTIVWKGLNKNGTLVPTGTYFYTIEINFREQNVKKRGFIELVQ